MSLEGTTLNRTTSALSRAQNQGLGYPRVSFGASVDTYTPSGLTFGASTDGRMKAGNGFFGRTKVFAKYLAERNNRPLLRGLFYQYGVPAMLGLSFLLGPVGWVLAIPGIPIAMLASWRGEKLVQKAVDEAAKQTGGLQRDPLKRLAKMGQIFENPTEKTAKEFTGELNRVLYEVMGGKKGSATRKVRGFFTSPPGSKKAIYAKTFLQLKAEHLAQSGPISRWFRKLVGHLKIGPLKPIMFGITILINALFAIRRYPGFKRILAENMKKAGKTAVSAAKKTS